MKLKELLNYFFKTESNMDYHNAMLEINDHRIKMSDHFQKRRLEHERFRNESLQVLELSGQCSRIVNFYRNEISFDSYKEFMLSNEYTAFLPIELSKFLKRKL